MRSQRERLLAAVVRTVAAKSYGATTVGDILGEAGVGRETFYQQFSDKRNCMLAAHKILTDDLEATVRAAYMEPGAWTERVRSALAAVLEWFAFDPAAARFTLVELAAVGPEFRVRFEAEFSRFVSLLDEGLNDGDPDPELPQATSLAVSATLYRVYEEVRLGRAAELPSLLPGLTYELLVPFLGEAVAHSDQRQHRLVGQERPANHSSIPEG